MISVLDYGVGNLGSVINMFRKIGAPAKLVTTPEDVANADKMLLPGIGAFDQGMEALAASGMMEPLKERVKEGTPLLGICLGMQLLGESSEEGSAEGLGFIEARSVKIAADAERRLKVPHMGWNEVALEKPSPLTKGLDGEPRFYFVHSYHLVCENEDDVLATVNYGGKLTCMVQRGNVYGAQFHPEKSHRFGMTIFKNFAEL